jgi:hypothetical protein
MRFKICLIAGIMGIAVISGIFEALASPRAKTGNGDDEVGENAMPAASE